ncbi:MAG TPA: sigma-70 family RNA polymerase sigma factor [Longimicrobiales bacterium]
MQHDIRARAAPASGGFPLTRLSVVAATGHDDPVLRRDAWDALIRSYWKPVYKYIRIRWQVEPDGAADLTQAFFTDAMDAGFFGRFDPARARFRTYLRVCLHGFVANARKAAARQKRGGGYRHLSLDFASAEVELHQVPASAESDPEQYFRTESIRSLLGLAVGALRDDCRKRGRDTHLALFERYDLAETGAGPRPTYQQLADSLGLTVPQVTNQLAVVRREFRRMLLDQLRAISGSEGEYRAEAIELLGVDPDDVAL